MLAHFSPEAEAEGTSRVTWEIEPVGDSCRLTLVHDQMREGANEQIYGGWPMILSGLKTWLETGELLTTPGLAHVHLADNGGPPMADDATTPQPALRRAGLVHAARVQPRRWPSSPAPASACGDHASCACGAARAGEWRTTPVNLLTLDDERTTSSPPRGDTQWVRNLRVAGTGELRVGKRTDGFRATEVADADKVAILRAYLKRWKAEVGRVLRRRERRLARRRPRSASPPTTRCSGSRSRPDDR